MTVNSDDVEAAQTFGHLFARLDTIHASAARAVVAEADKPLDVLLLAFQRRFHRSVRVVPHPPRNTVLLSEAAYAVAKEHALDMPVNDDVAADAPARQHAP